MHHEGIAFLPLLQLHLGAVALGVALVVPMPAIGGRFHEDGPAPARAATTMSCMQMAVATASLPSTGT